MVDLIEQRAELGDVEARRTTGVDAEIPPRHLAAERRALQAEKPLCPLQMSQRVRWDDVSDLRSTL